jgi:DNA-directed RNA polymerase subunit beta
LFKAELRSEESVKWAFTKEIQPSADGPLIQANERLSPSTLITMSLAGVDEVSVYRSVTFNAAPVMKRKHGIDISAGYVYMRTSELKGWVLADDVVAPEGEFLYGFNDRLASEEDELDPLANMIERGVRSFEVFFIDDNHFSFSLMNTLKSDQGKLQEQLEAATAAHPLVKEMLEFIEEANELDAENETQTANAFGYSADLPPAELAQIANSLRMIYSKIRPGDPAKVLNSYKLLRQQFFNSDRYDLSEVGRVKLNHKFKLDVPLSCTTLTVADIVEMIRYITALRDDNTEIYRSVWVEGEEGELTRKFTKLDIRIDDIDHLGNRRVRAVGELLENTFRNGLTRMERTIKDRLTPRDEENKKDLRKLINPKPVVAVVKEYFGSSQLSQFMDQTNPLSEVTHKRRLSALGLGGLSRDRAGFEVRDVHMTHYGRICPIETPEGPNIGLISSLSTFAQINEYGFIETPYRKVKHFDSDGKPYSKDSEGPVKSKVMLEEPIEYFNALDEEYREDLWETSPRKYSGFQHVAQAKVKTDDEGWLLDPQISVRANGDFLMVPPEDLNLVDVSPNQLVSVAASLIPFLENDDANRALMGSNMQRQAVPLLVSRSPLVGTGIEYTVGRDSGVTVVAQSNGVVHSVDADRIVIIPDQEDNKLIEPEIHHLVKFRRSNQNTCINQRPIVECGNRVKKGDVIADGPSTEQGELALGQNVVVAFMPWGGYNFEDSILISERLVQEDVYTSIHIEEFECSARDFNRLGPEQITRDISTVSEEARKNLDESGIVRVGSEVQAGDILVGKTTPKGETQLEPSEKLLTAVFGNRALDVRDTSLRVRTGVVGTVIGVKVFGRNDRDGDRDKRSARTDLAEETKIHRETDLQLSIIRSTIYRKLRELYVGLKASSVIRDANRQVILKKGETITSEKIEQLSDEQVVELRLSGDDRIKEVKDLLKVKEDEIKAQLDAKLKKLQNGDDLPTGVQKMVKVYVAIKRKLQVGDKMAGRHGNKGVISRVLPIEDMPFLEDGTPVEMVLNPLGVPSRMNIGQILETHLGWAARGLGKKISRMASDGAIEDHLRSEFKKYYTSKAHQELIDSMNLEDLQNFAKSVHNGIHVASPVFDGAPEQKLRDALELAGLRQDARSTLFNGRTGEPFDNQVTVGVMYVLKLHHLVDEKIHARSTGPYSLVTQQPLGGKAQFGGQRLGEMEVWAMEAYGAAYTLKEFLTVKSDDLKGRTQMYESIVKGEYELRSGLPESFRVLIQELKSLALDIELLKMDNDN